MERAFSVDDLVGGIWPLMQAGISRTDSEAAFQEFLKRIPSGTNLSSAATSNQTNETTATVQQLQQHLQQQQNQLQQHYQQSLASPQAQVSTSASALGNSSFLEANHVGMPRVPSLEFLRQLVVSQQQYPLSSQTFGAQQQFSIPAKPSLLVKAEDHLTQSAGTFNLASLTSNDLASLSTSGLTATLQAMPGLSTSVNPLAAAAAALNPSAAAAAAAALHPAAALQLGQLSQYRIPTSSLPGNSSESDKLEIRRARRMLSNRESARRSRRRKQEHLGVLELERDELKMEKQNMHDKVTALERRCTSLEDENIRIREENGRLRDELLFLRTEISERKSSYYSRRNEECMEASNADCVPKKPRNAMCSPPNEHLKAEIGNSRALQA